MVNKNSLETNPEAQQEYVTIKKLATFKMPRVPNSHNNQTKMDMDLMSIFEYIICLH